MLLTAQEVDFSIIPPVKMVFQPQRKRRPVHCEGGNVVFSIGSLFSLFFFLYAYRSKSEVKIAAASDARESFDSVVVYLLKAIETSDNTTKSIDVL